MEIRTCEEYVLSKLTETETKLEQVADASNKFRNMLIMIQECLEVFVDEGGDISIDIDRAALTEEAKGFLVNFLGRGKYETAAATAEENVEG